MIEKKDIERIAMTAAELNGNTDANFTETISTKGERCLCDKESGEILFIRADYNDPDDEPAIWEIPNIQKVRDNPNRFFELPTLDHGQWHVAFIEWLRSVGKEHVYAKSIGLTLKILAGYDINDFDQDKYYDWRNNWDEYKYNYYYTYITEFLKEYFNKQ